MKQILDTFFVQACTFMGLWYALDAYLYWTDERPILGVMLAAVFLLAPYMFRRSWA